MFNRVLFVILHKNQKLLLLKIVKVFIQNFIYHLISSHIKSSIHSELSLDRCNRNRFRRND